MVKLVGYVASIGGIKKMLPLTTSRKEREENYVVSIGGIKKMLPLTTSRKEREETMGVSSQ